MEGSLHAEPWSPYINDYAPGEYDYQETTDEEGFHELTAFCEPNVPLEAVTALSFDTEEEALWSGTSGGRIVSYLCPRMEKYSSWKAHFDEVRAIATNDVGVLSLSSTSLRFCNKGGYTHFSYSDKELPQLQCMTFTNARKSEVLLGGIGDVMILFDLKRARPIKEIPVSAGVTAMAKSSRYIAVGHSDGKITFRDPRTHRVEHTFSVHTAGVNDIDIHSDIVVTCGFGSRMGNVFVDPLVKVIDTRTMRVLLPLSVPTGPYFARFHPKFSSTIVVVSQQGRYELCDVQSGVTAMHRAVMDTRGQPLMSFDVAPTGESMTFGDAVGYIHQFAEKDEFRVNVAPKNSLEVLDMRPPPPAYKLTDNSSLTMPSAGTIPHQIQAKSQMNLQSKRTAALLSEWSHDMYFAVSKPPESIDGALVKSSRKMDFVSVIPNTPGTKLRNQVRRAMPPQIDRSALSLDPLASDTPEVFSSPAGKERPKIRAPRNYRHIPIKATKLGFEDFDFKPYNKTKLSGLENIMPNSYVNVLVQMYYYVPQMRAYVLNHLCPSPTCLLCELSFLFHMLDTAHGDVACQASNFIKIFREIPEVSRLGLLQEENASALVPWLATRFNSFFVQQLSRDAKTAIEKETKAAVTTDGPTFVESLFGSTMRTTNRCQTCNQETSLDNQVFFYNMALTPDSGKAHTFSTVLKQTLSFEQTTHTWCETCQTFQQSFQCKEAETLPNILVLHCDTTQAVSQFWAAVADDYNPHQLNDKLAQWIPFVLQIDRQDPLKASTASSSRWAVHEFNDASNPQHGEDSTLYELCSVVSSVQDNPNPKGHTTIHCKVPQAYHDRAGTTDSSVWYLFNDFHVLATSKYEATHINADWKSPCIIVYKRKDLDKRVAEPPVVSPITEEVMFHPNAFNSGDKLMKEPNYVQVTQDTLPTASDQLAIDSEFVRVREEEAIERPGGTRTVVRPSELSLARVSVLNTVTYEGGCIIDDYIATKEASIVDYLTKYSGIRPGDLDMQTSPHHLTSLKSAYLKLRWLVDRGCKFIGHGLQKDFRIINLIVPKEQVIDTVELFYLDRQRKISLKFLAAHLLSSDIQGDTHDSIEDARTALLLHRKYSQLKKAGSFENVLNDIYATGRVTQWKLDKAPVEVASEAASEEKKPSDEV